jgi:predicted nucleic acid-binding protein
MILVDTNIVVPLVVPTPNKEKCRALYQLDPDWHLSDWWQIEFANVLRNLHRAGQLETSEALVALDLGRSLFPPANTRPVDPIDTLRIACESNISAYDARFIALARSFGQKLVTEDSRLRKACPADTLSLDEALALFP